MPDPVTHYWFGQCVLSELENEICSVVNNGIYDRALQGPDPWSTIGFYGGRYKKFSDRSVRMHKEKTRDYLVALTGEAKENGDVFSVLAGNICHYCLDKYVHPYIICRSGDYDGTDKTYKNRNAHVRIERAIDSYIIREFYGKISWRFAFSKKIFSLKKYPESLSCSLDRVFFYVYGWSSGFDAFNRGLKDERRFYALMQDPFGVVKVLLQPFSRGRNNYCAYSYYRCDINAIDYLNDGKAIWHHPFDVSIESCDSVMDLIALAKQDAKLMIRAAYNAVYNGVSVCFEQIYGNSNYSTGFDCDDIRNKYTPSFDSFEF